MKSSEAANRYKWLRKGFAGGAGLAALAVASPVAAQVSNQTGQGADCQARSDDPRCTAITERPALAASSGTIVVTRR